MSIRCMLLTSALVGAAGAAGVALGHSLARGASASCGCTSLPRYTAGAMDATRWYPAPVWPQPVEAAFSGIAGHVWDPDGGLGWAWESAGASALHHHPDVLLLPDGRVLRHPDLGPSASPFLPAVPAGR